MASITSSTHNATTITTAPSTNNSATVVVNTSMDKFSAQEFYTVVIGGSILSTVSGCINAVVLTGSFHMAASHVTGNLTRLGSNIVLGLWPAAGTVSGLTLCFFIGSLASGIFMDSPKFQLGRSYGIALLVEAGILVLAWLWYQVGHPAFGTASAAFACGLQNAFCTGYSGAVLRTTHMTGITTDIGIICGQLLRRNPRAESWKLKVFIPLWLGFLLGSILGTWFTLNIGDNAILLPATFLCLAAIFYLTWHPAQEARQVLIKTVKKVQVELELGISKTVDAVVDGVDAVAHKLPSTVTEPLAQLSAQLSQVIPNPLSRSRHPTTSIVNDIHGFHPLSVISPPVSPVIAQMRQQVLINEIMDIEIAKTFKELEEERLQEKNIKSTDDHNSLSLGSNKNKFVLLNDEDDEDEETSIITQKSPASLN